MNTPWKHGCRPGTNSTQSPIFAPSTAEYYRRAIELHVAPRIGTIRLRDLTGRNLQKLYKDLQENGRLRAAQKGRQPGLSSTTVHGIHMMLHNAFDRAVKERLILPESHRRLQSSPKFRSRRCRSYIRRT